MLFKLLTIAGISLCTAFNSVYDYNVPLIEGGNRSLSEFSQKRILLITLPVTQNSSNDSLLYSLDTIANLHYNTLQVIAVPSIESGFSEHNKTELMQWYRSVLDTNIIITDGLYTQKTSANQHPLFHWLTHVDANNSFDKDVAGPGQKFFIRPGGILYGNLAPHTRMWSNAVNKTINLP